MLLKVLTPAANSCRGQVLDLSCLLFLIVLSDVQAVDPRYPFHPFFRSRWRVLELFFGPLFGSGYYHLLSGVRSFLAFRRSGLTSFRSRCRLDCAGGHVRCPSRRSSRRPCSRVTCRRAHEGGTGRPAGRALTATARRRPERASSPD